MTTTTATLPTVVSVKATMEYDSDMSPFDYNTPTEFHWERFGNDVEINPLFINEYRSPFDRHARWNSMYFDDQHPIFTQPRGARLVLDKGDKYTRHDVAKYGTAEVLKWITNDARQLRQWLTDKWHYVTIELEATFETTLDTGRSFTDTESDYLGGIENGLGGLSPDYSYADERKYQDGVIAEMVAELKDRLTKDGIVWPEGMEVERE